LTTRGAVGIINNSFDFNGVIIMLVMFIRFLMPIFHKVYGLILILFLQLKHFIVPEIQGIQIL